MDLADRRVHDWDPHGAVRGVQPYFRRRIECERAAAVFLPGLVHAAVTAVRCYAPVFRSARSVGRATGDDPTGATAQFGVHHSVRVSAQRTLRRRSAPLAAVSNRTGVRSGRSTEVSLSNIAIGDSVTITPALRTSFVTNG